MAHDVNQSEMDVAAQVRSALVARISPERFELWIPSDCQWRWDGESLCLDFASEFASQIASRMVHADLRASLDSVVGPHAALKLQARTPKVRNELPTEGPTASRNVRSGTPSSPQATKPQATLPGRITGPHGTLTVEDSDESDLQTTNAAPLSGSSREERTSQTPFEESKTQFGWQTFLPGSSNQMAWSTINMVLQEPGRMTPVLIHGPYGVGKSHLVSALAQQLRAQRRQRRVLHITAEQFTNDFTEAIRGGGLPILRRKYRDVETLILDDLQFLFGKKATINELRHTLDNLLKANRQVVFVSDRSLNDLESLGSELVARLRGGLVTPLLPLDEDTRFRLLKRDLAQSNLTISDDMIQQIAARAVGDGRLLKGITKRLTAMAYVNGSNLTWDQCWNAVFDLIQATQPIVRLGDIERVVCEVFGLEPQSLQSDRKTRSVSQPRMLAMFLARKYTPAAYKEIGDFFGHRRHSTVISAEKTVESWLEENTTLQLSRGTLAIRDAMRHVEATLQVG